MYDFVMENVEITDNEIYYMLEAASDTYKLKTYIYPKIEAVLKTPKGNTAFKALVSGFIDRNSTKLHTAGPQYLIPFTEYDKDGYFDLFNLTRDEVKDVIKEIVSEINVNADWKLLTNNPIFSVFFCCIAYGTIKNDKSILANSLSILSLAMYPSIFTKYYKYEPNEAVMQYTIDNLSNKYTIKKQQHIFGTLTASINQSWSFHKSNIETCSDKSCISFIMRIRNDQNSMMKKISNEYFNNHKKGLTVYTNVDSFDDNSVVDVENDSNKVEAVTSKVVMSLIINGVDIKLAEASAKSSHVSVIETRNYLNSIVTQGRIDEMKSFIESIIFLFLYEQKKDISDINSKDFLAFALALYKKTNSKDANIINIKSTLDKWGEEIGLHADFSRPATLVDYKRAIYVFFVFSIQRYNN